jgi:hypothetical protein
MQLPIAAPLPCCSGSTPAASLATQPPIYWHDQTQVRCDAHCVPRERLCQARTVLIMCSIPAKQAELAGNGGPTSLRATRWAS